MTYSGDDKRKISGYRLYAHCEVEIPNADVFASRTRWAKAGNLVFNMRGGCLYVDEAVDDALIETVFTPKRIGTFKTLVLYPEGAPHVTLNDLKVRFLRARREMTREGMVFRFLNFSDENFVKLEGLKEVLPEFDPQMEFAPPSFAPKVA